MMLFFAISGGILILDFISKYLISHFMELGATIPVISGIFDITYVQNTGAAWGIMADKQWLLQVITGLFLLGICIYAYKTSKKLTLLEKIALALILGGGLGNFISRLLSGYVVDFLNIQIMPVFNIADIGITAGCFLFVYSTLLALRKEDDDA